MTPFKCPVCQGTGNVPGGFYNSIDGMPYYSISTMEKCRACGGGGIVFSNEIVS